MPKATNSRGILRPIEKCKLVIPGAEDITVNNLPEIGDSKSAQYNAESIIGRSSPLHTYHYSDTRQISFTLHFFIVDEGDAMRNIQKLRAIQSAAYPRPGSGGAPFLPPPVCRLQCGQLLGADEICVVLQNYSVRFPSDVAWDKETLCPYRFDVDTTWWVVYASPQLPDQGRIYQSGY